MLRGNLAADLVLNRRSRSAATRRFSFEPIRLASLPTEWLVVCGVIVLPALGVWTLRKNLAEAVPYEAESLTRERRRMLLRDMGRPVFCVCAIGFVWKMIGYVVPQGNLGSFEGIMLGMSCATLVVAAIEQGDCDREEAQRALILTCGTQRGIRKGAADAAKRELDQALSDGGFASCEEARAAELSEPDLASLSVEIEAYQADYAETLAACERIEAAEAASADAEGVEEA